MRLGRSCEIANPLRGGALQEWPIERPSSGMRHTRKGPEKVPQSILEVDRESMI